MCNERSKTIVELVNRKIKVDSCLEGLIKELNSSGITTLGCCCGHGKYHPTIVIKTDNNLVGEYFTEIYIPRIKRFYLKDSEGYYYIPEVR